MKRRFFLLLLFGSVLIGLPAQSNQLVDRMLEDEGADVADAVYMVLLSGDVIEESASPGEAVNYARQQGWLPEEVTGDDTITFGRFAFLIMQVHGERGGIMYSLIPSPRYAAREAVFKEWSLRSLPPGEEISGETAVRVLGNYLATKGTEG